MEETIASKLITYLYDIIDEIKSDNTYQIKVDFLEDNINSYSIDKVPVEKVVENWVLFGVRVCQDTYTFRSRFLYSSDQADQLNNAGFWEAFENKIACNNLNRTLPAIDGIESIECLDRGSLAYADGNTCEMNIQIRITYREVIECEKSKQQLTSL